MKRFWPYTIQSRAIIEPLLSLGVFYVLSLWTFQVGLRSEIDLTDGNRLADRLVSIERAIPDLPVEKRDGVAHSLSGGAIEDLWSTLNLTAANSEDDLSLAVVRSRLVEIASKLVSQVAAPHSMDGLGINPHQIQVSIGATDASWVNFSITRLSCLYGTGYDTFLSATLMGLGLVLISVAMVRCGTRAFRIFGDAGRPTFVGNEAAEVHVEGPTTVRLPASIGA